MPDQVIVQFINGDNNIQSVTNWTSYNIQQDFFKSSDGFTLICEDDRAEQLSNDMQIGQRLQFVVNNSPILVGYVDSIDLSYDRTGGKKLTIEGRDICGILEDAHVYPNLGTNKTIDYQFNPTDTLAYALNTILVSNNLTPITKLVNEDGTTPFSSSAAGSLTFATGFSVGIRSKGKTGRGIYKSFTSNLNRLCKPEKGETYLRYASRLAKHAGCFIKCIPGCDNTLFIGPPTYDRTNFTPFAIQHQYVDNAANNAQHGRLKVSYKEQPSVIIGEATHGTATFRKQTFKVVCINECTGYQPGSTILSVDTAIPNVGNAIGLLTTGVSPTGGKTTFIPGTPARNQVAPANPFAPPPDINNPQETIIVHTPGTEAVTVAPTGYYLIPPNYNLYNTLSRTIINTQTNFSRPYYYVDYNAQTPEELMIGVTELMADFQDRFLELEYKVQNHSQNNVVWSRNLMCTVTDNAFAPGNQSMANVYWIEKVNFTKSRNGGTETNIVMRIPYTHMTNLTP
jgi:hypothetical protein